jgi:hypothetical protein
MEEATCDVDKGVKAIEAERAEHDARMREWDIETESADRLVSVVLGPAKSFWSTWAVVGLVMSFAILLGSLQLYPRTGLNASAQIWFECVSLIVLWSAVVSASRTNANEDRAAALATVRMMMGDGCSEDSAVELLRQAARLDAKPSYLYTACMRL